MSATTVIQRIATQHLGIKIGHKDAFYLWMDCQRHLESQRKQRAVHVLQEAVAGNTRAFALLAMKDAMSQSLLGINWPRRGLLDEQDVDTFPSLMRDAMRRRGIRMPSPNVSGLLRAA